ncbi:MAG: tRNA dihydrouridine synthase DusB [Candidatus Omnitrophica bacterium]|nr:tRNA dihydrouridine synthase DusB [Candidatus Omnitrophota bacterium]
MLEIGNLKLKSNLILAPMAGVSDLPFRMLNRRFGAQLAFVEMINAHSISYKSRRTESMLSTCPEERPLGVQLLGCEDKFILKALDILKAYKFDILDFNAACPAKKVVRRGEGSGMLKDPKKLNKLLKLVVKNSLVPVTVKIRAGWDKDSLNAKEVGLAAQDAGISGLFIHGRTKIQGYSGNVDYKIIGKVKKALGIPVIASGDILSAQLAKKMLDETGCDGLAIARGSLGNPWIFKEIKEFLESGKLPAKPGIDEIVRVMLEHLEASIVFYGERNGVVIFRKFFSWYTKGVRRIRPLREKSSRVKTRKEMEGIIRAILAL